MSKLIAVHGTNATGPREGDDWWQVGGALESDFHKWIEGDESPAVFEPYIWSGSNSEGDRYAGGERLAREIQALEDKAEPYVLVGHSHGGSVIYHALMKLLKNNFHCRLIQQWITVGTPFIEVTKNKLLFSRMNKTGVAIGLIWLYLVFVFFAFMGSAIYLGSTNDGLKNPSFDVIIIIVTALCLIGIYKWMRRFQPSKLKFNQTNHHQKFKDAFNEFWLPLSHKDDEAVQGLKSITKVKIDPFDRLFASPLLALGSLILVPIVMYFLSMLDQWQPLAAEIHSWDKSFVASRPCVDTTNPDCADPLKEFAMNNFAVIAWPSHFIFDLWRGLNIQSTDQEWLNKVILFATLIMGFTAGIFAFWVLGLVLHTAVLFLSKELSGFISVLLNNFTRVQLVKLGLGGDSIGERAIAARESPLLFDKKPTLPDELQAELTKKSNDSAYVSISKFRTALGVIAYSDDNQNVGEMLSDYLSWEELIHTNYFRLEKVRKLIIYAVSQHKGFKPSKAFIEDKDYEMVAKWYTMLNK